jgi:hypothetical protein
MALQTTKPTIPTKDKNSADPDIRKLRDSELNDIVNAFEKVDENFGELEQEIGGKQDGLGITDETTHLLTSKPIRKGAGAADDELTAFNDFPEKSSQFTEVEGEARIVQLGFNPSGSVVNFQIPEDEFGSLAEPLPDVTFSFTDARRNRVFAYVQAGALPTRLDPATNDDIILTGDAFNTTAGFVNVMSIRYQPAPSPQNRWILIKNLAVEVAGSSGDVDLVGHWTFDDDPTNDVIIDSGIYENHGTCGNGSLVDRVAGVSGDQIETNANDGDTIFEVPHNSSMDFSAGLTLMCWVTIHEDEMGNSSGLIGKGGTATTEGFTFRKSTANELRFHFNQFSGSTQSRVVAPDVFTAGVPLHAAVTYDNAVVRLYVNGVEVATNAFTDTVDYGSSPLLIAGSTHVLRRFCNLDEARVFRRPLTVTEINDIIDIDNPVE